MDATNVDVDDTIKMDDMPTKEDEIISSIDFQDNNSLTICMKLHIRALPQALTAWQCDYMILMQNCNPKTKKHLKSHPYR